MKLLVDSLILFVMLLTHCVVSQHTVQLGKGMRSNPPLVRVDPDNRCAAMLIHNTRLAILPFQQDELARPDKKHATGWVVCLWTTTSRSSC